MLIVDDILLFPMYSLVWVFREIHKAAQQELADAADGITAQLSELYMMLETGRIAEAEFNRREKELLDQLEKIQRREAVFQDKTIEEKQANPARDMAT